MKTIVVILVFAALLSGCKTAAERRVEQEQWQRFVNQCQNSGNVIYNKKCYTHADAAIAQQQDFQAAEAERNRQAMLQAACISSGGSWGGVLGCRAGRKEVNVNVNRY